MEIRLSPRVTKSDQPRACGAMAALIGCGLVVFSVAADAQVPAPTTAPLPAGTGATGSGAAEPMIPPIRRMHPKRIAQETKAKTKLEKAKAKAKAAIGPPQKSASVRAGPSKVEAAKPSAVTSETQKTDPAAPAAAISKVAKP
ncbi:MAG: hypothetical protein ABL907_02055 [Hyphomicrobium sp.]